MQAPAKKGRMYSKLETKIHSENFYDYKMRSLTLKPSFVGDVKKRNED